MWLNKSQFSLDYIWDVQRGWSNLKENNFLLSAQTDKHFPLIFITTLQLCKFCCCWWCIFCFLIPTFFTKEKWLFCLHLYFSAFPPLFWNICPQCLSHRYYFPFSSYIASNSFALLGTSEKMTVNLTMCSGFPKMWWCAQWQHDQAILLKILLPISVQTCRCSLYQRTVKATENNQLINMNVHWLRRERGRKSIKPGREKVRHFHMLIFHRFCYPFLLTQLPVLCCDKYNMLRGKLNLGSCL